MQYQVSYCRDTVYARNVEYIHGNSSSCIPISYLYKSIEAVTIFNTEKFFSKGLYDTGYHHTEKFAYNNKNRKVDVFNVGTFAFYFNKKYMFSSNGESISKLVNSAGEQNNNIFGKLERDRPYAILDHVFANDIKNAIHEDNVFGKKISLDTVEGEVGFANKCYRASAIRQYEWLTKVHQRGVESNDMTHVHEEKNINNESINCYGAEVLRCLNINQDILGKSRVNINLAIGSDDVLLYKDKSDAKHNEAYQLFKDHYNLNINAMNGMFKDIPNVSINNSTSIIVENPDLKINEYLATYRGAPLLRVAPQITIKTNNKDLKINESSSISSPIRELKKNEDAVTVVTTKGGLKLDGGVISVIRDIKRASVNEDIVIDSFSKQLMIGLDLEFFKYKKATFKNEYIGVNVVNKMVAKGEGYSIETRYRDLKEEEMYSLTPKDKGLTNNEYKIISDLIKEVYLETEQGITKYVKEFKNTISDKPLFLFRDEDYRLIINDMSMAVKNYKGLIENKNTIITKNLKDSGYYNKFDNLFIERNIITMNYTEAPVSVTKVKKRVIENIETIIIKNMHDTFKGQCVAIEKPNLYRASVVQDVIIQNDLKGTMYIRELYVDKWDYNTSIFDSEIWYSKTIKDCMIDNDMIGYGKIRKSLDKYEQYFMSKRPQDTYKEGIIITYDKGPGSVMVDEELLYGVMKSSIDTGIDNTDVGCVKNSSDSVYDRLIGYDKYFSNVCIEPSVVITKGPGNVTIDDGSCSWFGKFNTMDIVDTIIKIDCSSNDIDNSSLVIEYSKNTSDIMQDENIRIDSSTADIGFTENVNVSKCGVATSISKDETVSTIKGSLNDDDTSTVLQSTGKQSNANNIVGITKGTADTSFDGVTSLHDGWNNLNIDKTIKAELQGLNMSKYDNESIDIAKEKKDTQENKSVVINKAYLAANNDNVSEILSKALKEGGENNNVIISKLGHLVEKMPGLQKIIADREFKEVYIECSGKWVDGDEYDKPSLTGEGIDELLLPGTDYDYTKLEGTVIDSNGKPIGKNIEVIDNRTFITSTPVKHPLPETSNIGIEYIDLNIYVLRHLIDVTYKLWMKKAFKFGATDMRDAISVLMEDLMSYVDIVMDEPDKKHAERVLRLIRWYGEAAINNHAKYKIKVDFKKLSSDLYEGDCKIPYSFDNMHIDNNMYTITNTITGIGCSAEFYIDNPIDTKVQFILQVTSGTARVSINGEDVATVGVGMHRLEYDIEKLDTPNVLNIFYNGLSNGIINISNIVIFDMRYQGYTLEYHAVRGTGNKVMDNLIKHLANYEDMLSNNMEYIEAVKDNNYAITDVISKLLEYYDLHHEGKDKGKRITIKK